MSQWNQFLTEIANSIIQAHTTQKSLSLYVPFEDSLSKSLAFDKILQELLEREIDGNGTVLYSDFGENDITDEYKLSFAEKFFKPVSMSVNSSIPGFGTAGIALKYDSTRIEKKILDNSNNYRLIFLIQHWEWLDKELKLFFIRLINNISSYEKKYNKSIIILVGDTEFKSNDIVFSKKLEIHRFELNDLKDILSNIQTPNISNDLIDKLYPLTKGNLEKIYNVISLAPDGSNIEKLLNDLLNTIEKDFRENKIDIDFIYQLSVLPEYFNPYDAEEYFNLKTFQIEKAIDILIKLLVLIPVKNRINFYSLILIMKDKLLLTVEKGQKEIYRRYYQYLCGKEPFNYRLKIEIVAKLKESQEYLLSLYLLWHEHLSNQNEILESEKKSLYKLKFLTEETKSIFFKCIKYKYTDGTNSLYKEILPENSLLSSILLKNDINFQGNTSQDFSFHSLCDTLYENILVESAKDVIVEPIHYLSCIYMLLPHLIDKLNEIDKFQVLNEKIFKKFYTTKDIEQSAQYLKNIYLRKSFLYKDNDRSINDANIALKFFRDIDDFSQTFIKGRKYAIIGESGSGKSTLLQLLLGLKQAKSGSIFINGCDLNAINLKSYYKRIAYIDQSIYLINGSIRENITLGKSISDQELAEVVEKTQLSSFVGENLSGLDRKLVSNGLAISGGEKQRIALARAIVKDVDFIIIDETTSQLDKENRLAIEETILGLQDIGVIYISHNTESKVLELFDEVLDSRCFK